MNFLQNFLVQVEIGCLQNLCPLHVHCTVWDSLGWGGSFLAWHQSSPWLLQLYTSALWQETAKPQRLAIVQRLWSSTDLYRSVGTMKSWYDSGQFARINECAQLSLCELVWIIFSRLWVNLAGRHPWLNCPAVLVNVPMVTAVTSKVLLVNKIPSKHCSDVTWMLWILKSWLLNCLVTAHSGLQQRNH